MMKNMILFLSAMLTVNFLSAQYHVVEQGSSLSFKIKNFGFEIAGSFTGLAGSVNFDPKDAAGGRVDVSVDAATVNTDNALRDNHLRGNEYFDVQAHPRIRFVSAKIVPSGKDTYLVSGQLTIKNKTRDLSFPVVASASEDGYVFKGSFKINRRDFEVGGASTISDNLEVAAIICCKKI